MLDVARSKSPRIDCRRAGALSPSTNAVPRSKAPSNTHVRPIWCSRDTSPMMRNWLPVRKTLVAKGESTSDVPASKVSTVRRALDNIG